MGKDTVKIFLLFAIVVILNAGFTGCHKKESGGGNPFNITYDLQKTRFTIRFTDAKTGELLGADGNKSVTVTITGVDKDAVYDVSGLKKTAYKSKNGFMTLALSSVDGSPGEANPVRFALLATCNGYIPTAKQVAITKDGEYQMQIAMSKTGELPEGAASVYKTGIGTIRDSVLTAPLIVMTPGIETKMIIPAGTAILDTAGAPLESPLTVSIVYFSNMSDQCMSAFPGGPAASVYQNGSVTDGTFFSAGFVRIEITGAGGKKAARFEKKPATLEILVDRNTINTETEAPIAAGDLIGVYHFDENSGIWQKKVTDTIVAYDEIPPVGDFVVKTKVSSLFYYSLNWFRENNCFTGTNITFSADSGTCAKGYLQGILKRKQDSVYLGWFGGMASVSDTLQIPFVPASVHGYIQWINDSASGIMVREQNNPTDIGDLCDGSANDVPIVSTVNDGVSVLITVTAHCPSNPDVNILPSFGIWYRPEMSYTWQWTAQKDGVSEICGLIEGNNYVIGTYFDNQWTEWTVTIDKTHQINISFDFPSGICNKVFGM